MWRIRIFESRVGQLKRADEVHGLIHLSDGQEAVAAGVCGQLRDDDAVYSGHRAHGHAIARGAPLDRVMAELMGREDGLCRGLGGSMHLVDTEHGLMGATGVVGGNIPIALGTALAAQLDGGDRVAVVFFGDGAVQAGHFNETVNLATLWGLPLILVCENNGFAEFTPRSAHTNVERVSDVVAPYGLTRETVDGNDLAAVWETFGSFLAAARKGEGPMLLECLTHRLRGHYEGDPGPVSRGDRRRGVAAEGPDPAPPADRRRGGLVRRGGRGRGGGRGAGGGRGGGRVRPRQLVPLARGRGRARLRRPRGRLMAQTTFVKAVNATLAEAMRADDDVIVIGEDVAEGGPYTVTAGLAEEFGTERVLNTPISEAAICGVAIGAAQSGKRPVLEIMFIDFLTLALDQLVNAAAKAHFMSGGQLRRAAGAAHPGRRRAAAAPRSTPRASRPGSPTSRASRSLMPSSAVDAAGLLRSAIADPNPVVFVEHKNLYFRKEEVPEIPEPVPIGRRGSSREGSDVTIVALSRMVGEALAAAERLAAEGIEAEVIDPRTLVPFDLETVLESVRRTNRLVVAHEAVEHRRLRSRDRGRGPGGRLRLPRRADRARRRALRAGPPQPRARGRLPAGGRRGLRSRAARARHRLNRRLGAA